jgi:hypothetical protein
MFTQSDAEEDQAAGLTTKPRPQAPWRVREVEALPNFRLRVRFNDGLEGFVDISAMIHSPRAGVFSALTDPALFNKVFLDFGAVAWPGELDLAPDAMYDEIKAKGEWVLR